jgi:hypothetical protein
MHCTGGWIEPRADVDAIEHIHVSYSCWETKDSPERIVYTKGSPGKRYCNIIYPGSTAILL